VFAWIQADPPRFDDADAALRRGGVSIGTPNDGPLLNPVKIPEGARWEVRFPDSSWGTSFAVERLVAGLQAFDARTAWGGTVRLGSMSSAVGGRIGHHKSHQSGRDIDIRLPRKDGVPRGLPLKASRIDWLATWELLAALVDHGAGVIFLEYPVQKRVYKAAREAGVSEGELSILQYPRGRFIAGTLVDGHRTGVVRHFPGHDHHMHVRYACGPCEIECAGGGQAFDADP
jgi:hypothetical protein